MTEATYTICPPCKPFVYGLGPRHIDLADRTVNGLHVIGMHDPAETPSKASRGKGAKWVCRCRCGAYVLRRTGAIRSGGALPCDECKAAARAARIGPQGAIMGASS